ncbi:MAG: choice-of-anchor B family protein [Gemmatimonadota bacterium]
MSRAARYQLLLLLALPLAACRDSTGPGAGPVFEPAFRCVNGVADGFACDGVDLLGQVPLLDLEPGNSNSALANDIWGWTDETTGNDYVLVGRQDGVSIVDVTDPLSPRPIGRLPGATGASTWRDIKVYRDHAYVVADGAGDHGVQVFDLRRLRGVAEFTVFTEDVRYDGVSSVHNIVINEATGYAYAVGSNSGGETCGGGLHMIDIRTPASPMFAGCFASAGTGRAGTGYTHDAQCVVYDGPDEAHVGREICIGSNETAIVIADVTDKGAPAGLSTASYPDAAYVHQGWLTPDHRYFLQDDELDELADSAAGMTRLLVWDVSDLDDPVLAQEYFGPTPAVDHNLYVRGDLAYYSNYTYGIRIVDVSSPAQPAERGHFDTHPASDAPGFSGSWSNYPFFDNGVIAVSSSHDGLFLLQLQP